MTEAEKKRVQELLEDDTAFDVSSLCCNSHSLCDICSGIPVERNCWYTRVDYQDLLIITAKYRRIQCSSTAVSTIKLA